MSKRAAKPLYHRRRTMRPKVLILLAGSVSAFPLPPARARWLVNVPPTSYRRTFLIHHKSRHRPRPAFAKDDALAQIPSPPHRPFWQPSSKLQSLRRRLDTAEDKFDIHKISSGVYLASTIQILSTGATNGFESIPESLEASTNAFLVTSIIQGATSVDMALKYRQNDPIVRAGFINMAFNMISLGWAGLIGSPFLPQAISQESANAVMLLSLVPVFGFTLSEMVSLSKHVGHRKKRRNERGGDLGLAGDLMSYAFTTAAGFVAASAGIIILSDPSHDGAWLEHTFGSGDGLVGIHAYYSGIVTSLAVAIGALSITLRDRKIISKQSEQLLVGIPTAMFVLAQLKSLNIV